MTPFHRFTRVLAVPIFACAVVMALTIIVGLFSQPGSDPVFALILLSVAVLDIGLGILLIRRVPDNVIGLLCAIYGTGYLFWGINNDASVITTHLSFYPTTVTLPALFLMILYFPNGRIYPPRLTNVGIFLWLPLIVLNIFSTLTQPILVNVIDSSISQANPLFVPALAPLADVTSGLLLLLELTLVVMLVTLPFLRYRHANERTRLQMRWLTFMAIPMVVFLILTFAASTAEVPQSVNNILFLISCFFIIAFPPVSLGNAILRHRLYDIDIIIRRTLIYSILTAVLAAIYFGGVVLAQQVFRLASGESSDPAIVASTLLIAALFTPLRRRIQQLIDRRFYRRKYDAERTLARFNQTLRDEVDVETLKEHLVDVVQDTMQPDRMALWIVPQKDGRS
ncbi:MAG: hypothetical protein GC204_12945 [Chloroflexi bacterium]|nr:hypothetical protein [Chloroflexota bacterium]